MQPPNQPRQPEAQVFTPNQPSDLHNRWILLMVNNAQTPVLFTPSPTPNVCHLRSADGTFEGDFDVSGYLGRTLQQVAPPADALNQRIRTFVDPSTLADYKGLLKRSIGRDQQGDQPDDPPTQP